MNAITNIKIENIAATYINYVVILDDGTQFIDCDFDSRDSLALLIPEISEDNAIGFIVEIETGGGSRLSATDVTEEIIVKALHMGWTNTPHWDLDTFYSGELNSNYSGVYREAYDAVTDSAKSMYAPESGSWADLFNKACNDFKSLKRRA